MSDIYKYVDTIPPYDNLYSPYTDALNIKYIIEPVASDNLASDTSGKFHEIYENAAAGWRIYENKNAFPRFYMVPDARILPTSDEVFKVINEESVNPKDTVLLAREDVTGYIPQGNCQNKLLGAVTVQEYNPTSIHLQTNNHCDGFLMSSEIYYPGWQASIDGKNTPIWQGNLAFRVIFVPAGIHTIVYRYVPWTLYAGIVISFVTLLACLLFLWNIYRSHPKTKVV